MKGVMTMCRIKIWRTVVLFFGLFAILVFASCQSLGISIGDSPGAGPGYEEKGPPPWAPAHGARAKHNYRYYQDSRVYYEQGRGVYFYYRDGKWQMSVSLPSSIQINVGSYVTLEMDTDKPYEYDKDVVKRYPPGQSKKKDQDSNKKKGNK